MAFTRIFISATLFVIKVEFDLHAGPLSCRSGGPDPQEVLLEHAQHLLPIQPGALDEVLPKADLIVLDTSAWVLRS